MKLFSLLILLSTLILPKAWISYDLNWELEGDGYSASADRGALAIGYEDIVSKNLSVGGSYDVLGATMDGSDMEFQLFNLYAKYIFSSDETISIWGSLGYSIPTGDFDEIDAGLSYGIGASLSNGVGFYYIMSNLKYEDEYYYDYDGYYYDYSDSEDFNVNRMGLYISF